MKTRKIFTALMLLAATALVATSCKKDDDDARDAYVGEYSSVMAVVTGIKTVNPNFAVDTLYFQNLTFNAAKEGSGLKVTGTIESAQVPGLSIPVSLNVTSLEYASDVDDDGVAYSMCAGDILQQTISAVMGGTTIPVAVEGETGVADGLFAIVGGTKVLNLDVMGQVQGISGSALKIQCVTAQYN